MLKEFIGKEPCTSIDPDEAVAVGVSMQGNATGVQNVTKVFSIRLFTIMVVNSRNFGWSVATTSFGIRNPI